MNVVLLPTLLFIVFKGRAEVCPAGTSLGVWYTLRSASQLECAQADLVTGSNAVYLCRIQKSEEIKLVTVKIHPFPLIMAFGCFYISFMKADLCHYCWFEGQVLYFCSTAAAEEKLGFWCGCCTLSRSVPGCASLIC